LALVRSHWRAEVLLEPWSARFEMTHRRLVFAGDAFRSLTIPDSEIPIFGRLFAEAGVTPASR
jgi:hypothetical protein